MARHVKLAAGFNRDVVLDRGFTSVFEFAPAVRGPVELLFGIDVLLGGNGDAFNRQLAVFFNNEIGAGDLSLSVSGILAGAGDRQGAEFSSGTTFDRQLGGGVAVLCAAQESVQRS